MNSKQFAATIGAAVLLAWCWPDEQKKSTDHTSKKDSITKQNDKNLHDTLSHNTAEYYDSTKVTRFIIKDLIKGDSPALKVTESKSLAYMLWGPDVNDIIKRYNPHIAKTRPSNYNRTRHDIRTLDTLYVPNIFPSMESFFSPSLTEFLKDKPQLRDSVWGLQTVTIVTELPDGSFGMWFYKNGSLSIASPTSIGKWTWHSDPKTQKRYHGKSPQWKFRFGHRAIRKRSNSRDAMAYFNQVFDTKVGNDEVERRWLGRHWQWINTSRTKVPTADSLHRNKKDSLVQKKWGKRESHGCFRVPQLAWLLFDRQTVVDSLHWDPMIALWKQSSAELDSVEYYTKNRGLAKPWLAKQDTIPNPNPHSNKIKQHFQKELYRDSLNSIKQKASKQTYNNLKGRKK